MKILLIPLDCKNKILIKLEMILILIVLHFYVCYKILFVQLHVKIVSCKFITLLGIVQFWLAQNNLLVAKHIGIYMHQEAKNSSIARSNGTKMYLTLQKQQNIFLKENYFFSEHSFWLHCLRKQKSRLLCYVDDTYRQQRDLKH